MWKRREKVGRKGMQGWERLVVGLHSHAYAPAFYGVTTTDGQRLTTTGAPGVRSDSMPLVRVGMMATLNSVQIVPGSRAVELRTCCGQKTEHYV